MGSSPVESVAFCGRCADKRNCITAVQRYRRIKLRPQRHARVIADRPRHTKSNVGGSNDRASAVRAGLCNVSFGRLCRWSPRRRVDDGVLRAGHASGDDRFRLGNIAFRIRDAPSHAPDGRVVRRLRRLHVSSSWFYGVVAHDFRGRSECEFDVRPVEFRSPAAVPILPQYAIAIAVRDGAARRHRRTTRELELGRSVYVRPSSVARSGFAFANQGVLFCTLETRRAPWQRSCRLCSCR